MSRYEHLSDERDELLAENKELKSVLSALLEEAEDIFVCMADLAGIDRHNFPDIFKRAAATLKGE